MELDEKLKKELDDKVKDIKTMIEEGKTSQDAAFDEKLQTALGEWNTKQEEYEKAHKSEIKVLQDQSDELQTVLKEYKENKNVKAYQTPFDNFKDAKGSARLEVKSNNVAVNKDINFILG